MTRSLKPRSWEKSAPRESEVWFKAGQVHITYPTPPTPSNSRYLAL
jgi:hypothetical protein